VEGGRGGSYLIRRNMGAPWPKAGCACAHHTAWYDAERLLFRKCYVLYVYKHIDIYAYIIHTHIHTYDTYVCAYVCMYA